MSTATVSGSDPRVMKVLDLATNHLPRKLGDLRTGQLAGITGLIVREVEYGFLVWVPDDPTAHAAEACYDEPLPDEVLAVQLYARRLGCDWAWFDADADVVAGLPTWEW